MIKESDDKLITLGSIRFVGLMFGILVIITQPPPDLDTFGYLAAAMIFFFIYYFFLIKSYTIGDFSVVYPIARGWAPLFVLCLGFLFAKESLTAMEVLAILLISVGIITLSLRGNCFTLLPVAYAFGTAIAIAGYTVLCGMGVRHGGSFLTFAGYLETFTAIGVLLFIGMTRKVNPISYIIRKGRSGILAGGLSVFGYTSALWAMTQVPIATVAALRETSIIFAALIGTLYLKEGKRGLRLVSACLVAFGVIILGLEL